MSPSPPSLVIVARLTAGDFPSPECLAHARVPQKQMYLTLLPVYPTTGCRGRAQEYNFLSSLAYGAEHLHKKYPLNFELPWFLVQISSNALLLLCWHWISTASENQSDQRQKSGREQKVRNWTKKGVNVTASKINSSSCGLQRRRGGQDKKQTSI